MSRDADLLDDVVARLWTVRERLGSTVYRAAVKGALHGIGAAILEEAERRAGPRAAEGTLVKFPIGRRRADRSTDGDGSSR